MSEPSPQFDDIVSNLGDVEANMETIHQRHADHAELHELDSHLHLAIHAGRRRARELDDLGSKGKNDRELQYHLANAKTAQDKFTAKHIRVHGKVQDVDNPRCLDCGNLFRGADCLYNTPCGDERLD